MAELFGLLNVAKPAGMTSRTLLNALLPRMPRGVKLGHTGTLDPMATGVLLVCVGHATRLVPFAHRLGKSYRAVLELGRTSDTDDVTGDVQLTPGSRDIPRQELDAALATFRGRFLQTPPAVSALRVGGRRSHELAREGRPAPLAPREVEISRLAVRTYSPPRLELDLDCSTGTYIRALARDLGRRLGVGAVLAELERTAVGPFRSAESISLAQLRADRLEAHLLDPRLLLPDHVMITASAEAELLLMHGRELLLSPPPTEALTAPAAASNVGGRLLAIGEWRAAMGSFHPTMVFEPAQASPSRPKTGRRPLFPSRQSLDE